MSEGLKRCPFCSETEGLVVVYEDGIYTVHCETCGTSGPCEYTRKNAIKSWNERE